MKSINIHSFSKGDILHYTVDINYTGKLCMETSGYLGKHDMVRFEDGDIYEVNDIMTDGDRVELELFSTYIYNVTDIKGN